MACVSCWQQRQLLMNAWRQGNPYAVFQAMRGGVHIAADKYIRGVTVNRTYGGTTLAQNSREPRPRLRVR